MKSETKLFLGIIIGTIAVIAAGILLLSRSAAPAKVDSTILIRADSHKIASESASVTLVEFSDFQCPACGAYYAPVKQLVSEFAGSLSLVYRNFPLTGIHKNAQLAAQAAEAAGLQGKFWEMHDKLFETQNEWSASTSVRDIFVGYAESLNLDKEQFIKDMDSDTVKNKVASDVNDGNTLAVDATPTFFLNGTKLTNPASFADFESLIKAEIANAPKPTITKSSEYHIHANIKVYSNGTVVDFSQAKYQSVEGKELDPNIHFHDGRGDLIHIHKMGMKLGDLFRSLNYKLPQGESLYVNGKKQNAIDFYEPKDLDQILITDASEDTTIQKQITSVPDDACIYSLKCPDRGTPPTENCVGGLGTDCKD